MPKGLIERLERENSVADLVGLLAERLAPTDLQSLLLEVYARAASRVTPARLLEQYEHNRFVAPSPIDPRMLVQVEALAWKLLPPGYVPLELSPLCPLGTHSSIATVSQHKVVSTIRNTEVLADLTNALALECALRRRTLLKAGRARQSVLLAATQRVTRAQAFKGPKMFAHFRLLGLCAASRDLGSLQFECDQLVEQVLFYVRLLREMASLGRPFKRFRVAVTDLTQGEHAALIEERVLKPLSSQLPDGEVHFDPKRASGRGYYETLCFKLYAADEAGKEWELGDGGATGWTRLLLSNAKERLVTSGLGVERLCAL